MRIRILPLLLLFLMPHILASQESPILWMKGRHTSMVVAIERTGSLVATVSNDSTFRLWDESTGNMLIRFGLGSAGTAVALSGDGALVAAGDSSGRVRVWNTATGQVAARLPGFDRPVRCVAFSADRSELTAAAGRELTTWKIASTTTMRSLQLESPVHSSASSGGMIVLGLDNGRLAVIDKGAPDSVRIVGALSSRVTALALDIEETTLVVGSDDGRVSIFDTHNWSVVKSIAAHPQSVLDVGISHDSRSIASVGRNDGLDYRRLAEDTVLWSTRQIDAYARFGAVEFSDDSGRLLAGDSEGRLIFITEASGEWVGSLTKGPLGTVAHSGSRIGIGAEATGRHVYGGSGNLQFVEGSTGRPVSTITNVNGAHLTADGARLIAYDSDGTPATQGRIRTLDVTTGALLSRETIDTGAIELIGSGPAGEIAVSAFRADHYSVGCFRYLFYRQIGLWDTTADRFSFLFSSGEDPNFGRLVLSNDWNSAAGLAHYFRCDGGYTRPPLSYTSRTGSSTVCNLARNFLAAHPSTRDRLLVVINSSGTAELLDPYSLASFAIGDSGRAVAVAFSRDESLLAVSGRGGSISLFDVDTRTLVRTIDDIDVDQISLVFAGDFLVSSAIDGTTIVRRFETTPAGVEQAPGSSTPAGPSLSHSPGVVR